MSSVKSTTMFLLQKKPKLNTSADVDIISKFNAFEKNLDTLDKKLSFLDKCLNV